MSSRSAVLPGPSTVDSGSAIPLTVRIVDGRLFVCSPTRDMLEAAGAPIDVAQVRPVPVIDSEGSPARYFGAPVSGALRFLDWLCSSRPLVDAPAAAIASLIVEAAELSTAGEVVPDVSEIGEWSWRAAPGPMAATRIDAATLTATDAVDDGDPDETLAGWFAGVVSELALARLGTPDLAPAATSSTQRWAEQAAARASTNARLRFHLLAPEHLQGAFLLQARLASSAGTAAVPPLAADAAELLGTTPYLALGLVASEWRQASAVFSPLGEFPTDEVLLDADELTALLTDGIGALASVGIDVHVPSSLLASTPLVRRMTIAGSSAGLDEQTLALSGEVLIDGDPLTAEELEVLARASSEIVSVRGRWVRIDEQTRAATAAFVERIAAGTASAAEVLAVAATADEVDVSATDGWLARALEGEFHPTPAEEIDTPESMAIELRHYQRDGLAWLAWLEANGLGGILADQMGTGKTCQVLALTAHDTERPSPPPAPTLVVAPTSVVSNWEREATKFAPGLRVAVHHGSSREDPSQYVGAADLVVTSYGVLRRDESLREVDWHRVVLDEAQTIKNPSTATAKAARELRAPNRLAVTGTPVENHLGELWSLMTFANPGLLGTQAQFKARYANALDADQTATLESLRRTIAPFMLRRHKTDPGIADELPDRIIVRDDCTLTREQVALYQAVVDDMRSDVAGATGISRKGKVLAGITKLKQICNHPATLTDTDASLAGHSGKLDRLVELAAEIVEEGEAVVVFSQYATFLRRIAEHLRGELDVGVESLDGKMARTSRDQAIARFDDPAGPPIMCVSLKAGGTGLNLVRANHVIHFDRWWNPAVEDQASDRVWRIGQTRGVVVHTLVCPGTLEERIADLLDQKRTLADAVVSSSPEQLISELDDAALAALVELDTERAGGLR